MRRDVSFASKGLACRGWLYLADGIEAGDKMPTVVMAHGFSAVKEQSLPAVAARIAEAGFGVLLFDYRTFGCSDGEHGCREVAQMRRERDAALAVVEAAQQHKCLGRTDGYNSGCPICSALAASRQLDDKGVK